MEMKTSDQSGPTVGQREQFWCPLWRWAYPADSPCAHTDDFHIGENDPAISEADRAKLRQLTNSDGLPWLWIGLGIVAVYFAIRGMEAYAAVKNAS